MDRVFDFERFFLNFESDDLTSEGVICVTLKRTFPMAPEKLMFFFRFFLAFHFAGFQGLLEKGDLGLVSGRLR